MRLKCYAAVMVMVMFLLALLAGCSSSSDDVQPAQDTAIKGKIVDRWSNATVCLDISEDGSCLDETKYVTASDAEGAFNLGEISWQEVSDYDIIAEATANTQAANMTGRQVHAGDKMTAPGFITADADARPLYLSPLLTVINEISKAYVYPFGIVYSQNLKRFQTSHKNSKYFRHAGLDPASRYILGIRN